SLENVRQRKERKTEVVGTERQSLARRENVRNKVAVREHCPFWSTGSARRINNGSQVICLYCHCASLELARVVICRLTPHLVQRVDSHHVRLINRRIEGHDIARSRQLSRGRHFFQNIGRRDENDGWLRIEQQCFNL